MKPKTIDIDGVPTEIRVMGSDYVVGDDPAESGVTYAIKCWPGRHVPGEWPNRPISTYFRKIMEAYGTSAITAWQEKKLVGFLPFMPADCGMPEVTMCVVCPEDKQTPMSEIEAALPVPFERLKSKTLKVHCASVGHNPPMYRKGIGYAMLRYLVDWAKEQGWEKIEGWAFTDHSVDEAYKWIPSVQFWEKAGAKRGKAPSFPPDVPPPPGPVCEFSIDLQ